MEKHRGDDIDACMEKLENVGWGTHNPLYDNVGLGTHNPLYDVAVMLFSESADYRKVWMRLKPESLENWVRNAGRKYGHAYTQELLRRSNTQCQELMRLSRDAYVLLCNHFKERNWLQNSRNISVEEKMAMFLTIIGMMQFAREVIVPTSFEANTSERHRNLREIFTGALGALDGTLVHAVVPVDQQIRYRGRGKGECFQNVLGMCDFNMMFTFVWAGWEGIAHDSRVLTEVAFNL
ncbi:hypothetical protein Tco_0307448 [Tanacetum coccineum]